MPTRSQRIRQSVRGGPIDKLKAEVEDMKEQVKGFKEIVKSSHMIHDDGTYSNARNTKILMDQIRHRSLLIIDYQGERRRVVVRDFDDRGVWTKPAEMRDNPSLHLCNYWKWAEIELGLREVQNG